MTRIQTITLHKLDGKTSAAVFYDVLDETETPVSLNNRCEVDLSENETVEILKSYIKEAIEKHGEATK